MLSYLKISCDKISKMVWLSDYFCVKLNVNLENWPWIGDQENQSLFENQNSAKNLHWFWKLQHRKVLIGGVVHHLYLKKTWLLVNIGQITRFGYDGRYYTFD